ncbi:putative exported protein [Halobacteriovorax marinus SJ]|uniref:Exported protein n=1 Tax=Halobacteriovorax marinus (strain ATCC BAA-682 / DSM 15412 / SJ) TaxID=862908 RepID=E1X0A2_HALMS|nr:hypothetical protein [Halobacteriovorax marinus]CBW26330.1 putative exported protein [Halobacteriovorax marinus SJ]
MYNRAAKFILITLLSFQAMALPGMSNVVYDFSVNSGLFSSAAIKCQDSSTKSNTGLDQIAEFMNQMNCNKITDPTGFCNCVNSVSNKGIAISDEEAEHIRTVIDSVATKKVMESLANEVDKIEGYKDVVSIMSSEYKSAPRCFDARPGDTLFGRFSTKQRRGIPLDQKDQLLKTIFNKIHKDVADHPLVPLEDVLSDATHVKYEALRHNIKRTGDGLMQSSATYDINNLDWNLFNDSPVSRLLKRNPELPIQLGHFRKVQAERFLSPTSVLPFSPGANQSIATDEERRRDELFRRAQFNHSDGTAEDLVNSAVENACSDIRREINKLVESLDIEKNVRSIKAALFNPTTEREMASFRIIEDAFAKKLSGSSTDDKKRVQEFIFNMDILYCRDLKISQDIAKNEESMSEVEKLRTELQRRATEAEVARQEKSEVFSKLEEERKRLRDYMDASDKSKQKIALYQEMVNGKYLIEVNGVLQFDLKNIEFLERVRAADKDFFAIIREYKRAMRPFPITKEKLLDKIDVEFDSIGRFNNAIAEVRENLQSLDTQYLESQTKLALIEDAHSKLYSRLEKKVGSGNAISIVASADKEVNRTFGVKSGVDYVVDNEIRQGRDVFAEIEKSKKVIADYNSEEFEVKSRPTQFEDVASVEEQVVASTSTDTESVTSPEESSNTFSNNTSPFDRKPASLDPTSMNTNTMAQRDSLKASDSRENTTNQGSNRQRELEEKLKELEALAFSNNNSATSKEEKSESAIDKQIEELKEKINIEKIRSEKLKVANEIKGLKEKKNQLTSAPAVSAPVAQVRDFSSSTARAVGRRPATAQRSSSVSSNSSAASSGGNFSSGSLSSTSSSSSSAAASTAGPSSSRESVSSEGSNFEKSKTLSLRGVASSSSSSNESALEIATFTGDTNTVDARLVKVDFNLNGDVTSKEKLLESLFIDGEEEIIVETPEGEKIIVKNNTRKPASIKKEENKSEENTKKMRHQNLIDLLKIGQIDQ